MVFIDKSEIHTEESRLNNKSYMMMKKAFVSQYHRLYLKMDSTSPFPPTIQERSPNILDTEAAQTLALCRCSISESCVRVIRTSFSRFSLNTSHFPAATISFSSSSATSLPETSSCRMMKSLQRSCFASRPSLYCSIT